MSSRPTHYSTRYKNDLTPRQREVLTLIVRGKTNAEIAAELGIGFDTVKTHVSEILGKLGVDTREEAAAAWRSQRGIGDRARRTAGSFFVSGFGKAAAGIGIALVAVGVAAALVIASRGETPATSDNPDVTTTPAATRTPVGTTPTALATATPGGTGLASATEIAGLPVQHLGLGEPVEFPAGVVAYANVRIANSGYEMALWWRTYRDANGDLRHDAITLPGTSEDAYLFDMLFSPDGAVIYAGLCRGYCGGHTNATAGSTNELFRSDDGGISWESLGMLPAAQTRFVGWYEGEVLLSSATVSGTPEQRNETFTVTAWLFPSGRVLPPPPGIENPGPWLDTLDRLTWIVSEDAAPRPEYDSSGALVPDTGFEGMVPGVTWSGRRIANSPETDIWRAFETGSQMAFFGQSDRSGEPTAVYATPVANLWWFARVDAHRWLGSGTGGNDFHAVLIDTDALTISPILGLPPFDSTVPLQDTPTAASKLFTWPVFALTGNFARVATGGDCLNILTKASTASETVDCYADGVLLRVTGPAVDGWRPVQTPAGAPGFAASEFLE